MNQLNLTKEGGWPIYGKDLNFILGTDPYYSGSIIDALTEALVGISGSYSSFIVYGCHVTGSNVSSGWIVLNGRLYKVYNHTKTGDYFEVSSVNSETRTTIAGTNVDVWTTMQAHATASSGNLNILTGKRLDQDIRSRIFVDGPAQLQASGLPAGNVYNHHSYVVPSDFKTGVYNVRWTVDYNGNSAGWTDWRFNIGLNGVDQAYKYLIYKAGATYLKDSNNTIRDAIVGDTLTLKAGDIITLNIDGTAASIQSPSYITTWAFEII